MTTQYLYPEYEAGKNLFQKNIKGPIFNLNLLRLKKWADYTKYPEIQPATKISGLDAFVKYVEEAKPYLYATGGEIIFIGQGDHFLIGPEKEYWHICMLVKQKSVDDFFAFEQNTDYMKITGHRIAAIEDARLLPLEEILGNTINKSLCL